MLQSANLLTPSVEPPYSKLAHDRCFCVPSLPHSTSVVAKSRGGRGLRGGASREAEPPWLRNQMLRVLPPPRRIVLRLTKQTRRPHRRTELQLQTAQHHNHIYNKHSVMRAQLTIKCNVSKYKPRTQPYKIQNNSVA